MAYTSPNSARATNYVVTAANWNELADDIKWLAETHPSARVFNSATISITTSGTAQALTFNSERWDIGGTHSTASLTSRLTVPSGGDGVYAIGGSARFAANATGDRQLQILVNATTPIAIQAVPTSSASADTILTIETLYRLVAGDYVELYARQTAGAALNITFAVNYSPEFWFEWREI